MPISNRVKVAVGVGVAVLLGTYLLGFVPQYRRNGQIESELRTERGRIQALESAAKLAKARDLASALFIETVNKNYGTASTRASEFFNHIRSVLNDPAASEHRGELEWMLAQRDSVIANLAKSDPSVQKQVQDILERFLRSSGLLKSGG